LKIANFEAIIIRPLQSLATSVLTVKPQQHPESPPPPFNGLLVTLALGFVTKYWGLQVFVLMPMKVLRSLKLLFCVLFEITIIALPSPRCWLFWLEFGDAFFKLEILP
jgi:hypothetical protein